MLNKVVGIRFDDETYNLLKQIAEARRIQIADFVRESVMKELARLSFLSEDHKKILLDEK
jgi:predicted transcriptional regulator